MEIETGRRREVMEPGLLQELIEELKCLRRETAGYTYLFKVPPEDVEEFEEDLEAGRVESLQLKFSDHGFVVSERATITKERDTWILADLRFSFQIIKDKNELIVYGKKKGIPLDYELKYESGIQTITTATTQPDTIGTYPPDESYPNKELVRERSRSEIYPLGRNAPYLWVKNEGPGNLYILSTTNGVEWGYAETILSQNEVRVFENVYALALRTDVADTQYHASEYKIITGQINISKVIPSVVHTTVYDFSTTINSGARSPDTNITGLYSNKIKIVGVAVSSESDTDWRVKFYSQDTFDGAGYDSNTFIGNVEITALSAEATGNYVGDVETDLYYVDSDTSKELHVILENSGANNSKAYLTILYLNVE